MSVSFLLFKVLLMSILFNLFFINELVHHFINSIQSFSFDLNHLSMLDLLLFLVGFILVLLLMKSFHESFLLLLKLIDHREVSFLCFNEFLLKMKLILFLFQITHLLNLETVLKLRDSVPVFLRSFSHNEELIDLLN
jgi:hypothetical protein